MKFLLVVAVSFTLAGESAVVFADDTLGNCLSVADTSDDVVNEILNYSSVQITFLSDAQIEEMKALRSSLKNMDNELGLGMGMGGFGLGTASTGKPRTGTNSNAPIEIAKVFLDGEFITDVFVFDWSMDLHLNVDKGKHEIKVDFPSHKDYETQFTAVGNHSRQQLVIRMIPVGKAEKPGSK
ncbi:hypothetical protein [Planctomycetes bacterium K23_9]